MSEAVQLLPLETITHHIMVLRGQKILLDSDLAALYGVDTRRLNEQVKRNRDRFPKDFIFELTREEFANLKSQFATSSWGGRRKLPLAFTEHGAIMTATVLSSTRAVEMSVYVVRAFVQLREVLTAHKDLAIKLASLERQMQALALKHESLAQNSRLQLKQVFEAIHELMTPMQPVKKRSIGFVSDESEK